MWTQTQLEGVACHARGTVVVLGIVGRGGCLAGKAGKNLREKAAEEGLQCSSGRDGVSVERCFRRPKHLEQRVSADGQGVCLGSSRGAGWGNFLF